MAYGNWGAKVEKDGERRSDREDQTPYQEEDLEPGYWQAFGSDRDKGLGPHHADMGDGEIRLCGYKSSPVLYDKGERVDLKQFYTGKLEEYDGEMYLPDYYDLEFEYKKHKIVITTEENFVDLKLIQPDGGAWEARCGYCYGTGWED